MEVSAGRVAAVAAELKRRHVLRVGFAYGVVGWFLIQVAETTLPALALPDWTVTFVIVLVLLGAPMALALAWAYDVTPEGVERTPKAAAEAEAPAAEVSASTDDAGVEPADHTRIIVLPFRMLRPDPEMEFLTFSLPDAITASLSGLGSLIVRSQIAALRFAKDAPDLAEIAERAHVDVVVTGTVVRAADRVRVTAQLTDVRDGTLLWSQAREIELGDVFELQEQLTRTIVSSLRLPLDEREHRLMLRDVPATARGYEFYLRANQLAYELGQWQTARDLYLQSVEEDPAYAPAWARLARCYRLIGKYTSALEEAEICMAQSRDALERALLLNPDLSLAQNLYAQLEVDLGQVDEAMGRLLALVRHNDSDAQPFAGLVHACRFAGLLNESLAAHHAARRLDPTIVTSVNHTCWMLGEYDAALHNTTGGGIGYMPGLALASLGRADEAIETLRINEAALHEARPRAYLRSLRALLEGDRAAALSALDIAAGGLLDGEAAYYLARCYARLGEAERALTELGRVVDAGFVCMTLFAQDPWLDDLRDKPRFQSWLTHAEAQHDAARASFNAAGGGVLLTERVPSPADSIA